jgi:hypothetical protein
MAWCWDDVKKNGGLPDCSCLKVALVNPFGDPPAVKKAKEKALLDFSKVCPGCEKEFSVSDPDTLTEFRCVHNHVMHTKCVMDKFHLTFMKSKYRPIKPKCPCCKDELKV